MAHTRRPCAAVNLSSHGNRSLEETPEAPWLLFPSHLSCRMPLFLSPLPPQPRDVSATLWVQVEGEIGDSSYLLGSLQVRWVVGDLFVASPFSGNRPVYCFSWKWISGTTQLSACGMIRDFLVGSVELPKSVGERRCSITAVRAETGCPFVPGRVEFVDACTRFVRAMGVRNYMRELSDRNLFCSGVFDCSDTNCALLDCPLPPRLRTQGGGPCAQISVGHCLTSVDGEVIIEVGEAQLCRPCVYQQALRVVLLLCARCAHATIVLLKSVVWPCGQLARERRLCACSIRLRVRRWVLFPSTPRTRAFRFLSCLKGSRKCSNLRAWVPQRWEHAV